MNVVGSLLTVALTIAQATPPPPPSAITQKDEAALFFLMSAISRRTAGDPARVRSYLPRKEFDDREAATLAAISRDGRFSSSNAFQRYGPNSKRDTLSHYLRSRLEPGLFSKVLVYCRASIEPRMRSMSAR